MRLPDSVGEEEDEDKDKDAEGECMLLVQDLHLIIERRGRKDSYEIQVKHDACQIDEKGKKEAERI